MTDYLDLVDYLLIAEAVTGGKRLCWPKRRGSNLAESALAAPQAAFGEVEFYPDFVTKAAGSLCAVGLDHPLPDGNKRAAWVALREFCARNGYRLTPTSVDDAVSTIEALAAHAIVRGRTRNLDRSPDPKPARTLNPRIPIRSNEARRAPTGRKPPAMPHCPCRTTGLEPGSVAVRPCPA